MGFEHFLSFTNIHSVFSKDPSKENRGDFLDAKRMLLENEPYHLCLGKKEMNEVCIGVEFCYSLFVAL